MVRQKHASLFLSILFGLLALNSVAQNIRSGILDIENHPYLFKGVNHNIKVIAHGYDSTQLIVENAKIEKVEERNYLFTITPLDTGICSIYIHGITFGHEPSPAIAMYRFEVKLPPMPILFLDEISSGNIVNKAERYNLSCKHPSGVPLFEDFEILNCYKISKNRRCKLDATSILPFNPKKKRSDKSIIIEAKVKNSKGEIFTLTGVWSLNK